MPESLEEFLGKSVPNNFIENTEGSFECQTCGEKIFTGYYNEEESILIWYCSEKHRSQVSL